MYTRSTVEVMDCTLISWKMKLSLVLLSIMMIFKGFAQRDSLVMKNGDILVGEIKDMNKGVLILKTSYSDKDFNIEWIDVREAYGNVRYLLLLTDGRRLNGTFYTDKSRNKLVIRDEDQNLYYVALDELVYIKGLKSNFWGRSSANIDIGFNLAKTNSLKQFTANLKYAYLADTWQTDLYYNHLYATQQTVEPNRRIDAGYGFRYFLQKDWFLSAFVGFLSNTEQALKLRTSGTLGVGRFLRRTNRLYLATGGGVVFNNEVFYSNTPRRNSLELLLGGEVNLFDIGDLNLHVRPNLYMSLTESGRWRFDLKGDLKYDLPMDFYIKTSLNLNYDNRPAVTGNETDYVWSITFGWEL